MNADTQAQYTLETIHNALISDERNTGKIMFILGKSYKEVLGVYGQGKVIMGYLDAQMLKGKKQ